MLGDDGEIGSDKQSNGKVSRGGRDQEFGARCGDGNRNPCRDGWGIGRASVALRRGEEGGESDIEEVRNE